MTYDYKSHKIVAIISDNLESWQAMNVLGHMAISLGANKDEMLMGRDALLDKDGVAHKGIARFGFIIKKGTAQQIADTILKARNTANMTAVDFPREMLDTQHDDELAEALAAQHNADLEYLGAVLYGATSEVDGLTKGFKLFS